MIVFRFLPLLLLSFSLCAQQNVSSSVAFKDGIYRSFEEFRSNNPSQPLPPKGLFALADKGYVLYMEPSVKANTKDAPWGLCKGGIPYKLTIREPSDTLGMYVKFHVLGNICYYYYEGVVSEKVPMHVYHPTSGEVLMTKMVINQSKQLRQMMLRFDTGEIAPFTPENFLAWTRNDQRLSLTLRDLSEKEKQEKLYKTLLIYNDRNPVGFK